MKVAIAGKVWARQVGGNSRYVRNLVPGLREQGIDVEILDGTGRTYLARESLLWPRTSRADVLHFPADNGPLVPARVPVVGTIHGMASLHVPAVRSPRRERVWRYRMQRLAAVADRLVTVSESSARDLSGFLGSGHPQISVVPLGVDHERFHPVAGPTERADLTRLGVPDRYVAYVGNLEPRKNVVELANAAVEVAARTGVPLVVAGAPAWDAEEALAAVDGSPATIYLGRVDENMLAPLMRHADAFCFPSYYEGFGLPVLEAMACGVPVLCSDRGSLPEVGGDAVSYVDDLSAEGIADGLVTLLTGDDRAAMTARGIARAATFTWRATAEKHARVYQEVAA